MRIHVGCGAVYLKDWVNCDLARPGMHLAETRPDLVEALATTEDAYYARQAPFDKGRLAERPVNREGVCDIYGSALSLPVADGSVSEILARQVFEHLSPGEAERALGEFARVLAPCGILRLDVPDHEATVWLLMESHDPFYFRHLYGTRTGPYACHLAGYSREGLWRMCRERGFSYVAEEPNIHAYPAFCLKFAKACVSENRP